MRPRKLIYIDYASKGNSGAYSIETLKPCTVNATAFLHFKCPDLPFYHIKVFRIFSALNSFFVPRILNNLYKCIDLYFSFFIIYLWSIQQKSKYDLVFWVQFHQSFHAYKWLFKKLSTFGKLVVTVHDAVELKHNYPSIVMSKRDDILKYSNLLVVHNSDSVNKLSYLNIPFLRMPFPLLEHNCRSRTAKDNSIVKFLFIGHVRQEKGLDTLIAAWRDLPSDALDRACLTIAGTGANQSGINFSQILSCKVYSEYLSDEKFSHFISDAHYVVLPYRGGTNSGVMSEASALEVPCITTNLPVFTESPFYLENLNVKDTAFLSEFLLSTIEKHKNHYYEYVLDLRGKKERYRNEFGADMKYVYKKLLTTNEFDIL